MNQSISPISDSRNESAEVSRRLYRCMMETARQLDDHRSYAKTTRDLFTVQAEVLRIKLREYAERLIFSNSLGQGRKIEEVLWRKGFYDDVCSAKRLKKEHQWSPEEKSHLQIHLTSGVGFYHHLLLRFQSEYGLSCSTCIDFPMIFPDKEYSKSKISPPSKQMDSIKDSVHRCLVCLGDMSRYLMDISPSWYNRMAARYYCQALSWNPELGMPHNQLGNLSGSLNHSLDAAYHYLRCLICSQPFEGAEGNLKRILERNSQRLSEEATLSASSVWHCRCSEPGDGHLSESQDLVQRLISHFLLLIDVWFFDKRPVYNLSELCHQILLDFRQCIKLTGQSELDVAGSIPAVTFPIWKQQENFPSFLNKDVVFKMVVMILVCLSKLRNKGSDQTSSAVAFLLAMFSFLSQQVLEHLKDSVFNFSVPLSDSEKNNQPPIKENGTQSPENPVNEEKEIIALKADGKENGTESEVKKIFTVSTDEKENGHVESDVTVDCSNGKQPEDKTENKTKKLKRIRKRRQRRINSEDSDHSDIEDELNASFSASDVSEDEEVVLDLSSDDEDKLDMISESGNYDNNDDDVVVLEEAEEFVEGVDAKSVPNGYANGFDLETKRRQLRQKRSKPADPLEILEQICGEGLLPSIKVCTDWLLGDTTVIQACGRDSSNTLKLFVELVSIINIDLVKLREEMLVCSFCPLICLAPEAKLFLKHNSVLETGVAVPLPEDILLQNLAILNKAQENLDWEAIYRNHLNSREEAFLRVQKLVKFCHFLETVPETGVQYNKETRIFSVTEAKKISNDTPTKIAKPSVDLERRGQLMQNMGQLWLRAEVQNLESSVKRGSKGASFSPYLVLDVDALTKYMQIVSHLMLSRKFIMVVPSVVLSALDQMKRESVLARDAIRWLEFQFQKGSRFLRAQTTAEVLHLPLISYPKQKAREAWTYFKILECCHFLNQQNSTSRGSDKEARLVTLLTGHEWTETSEFSPVGTSKAVGIALEHIEEFYAKWKTSSKSHG